MKVSALVSAYYAEAYLVQRLENLAGLDVETVVICQSGSVEHKIAYEYPCRLILTDDIPTLYRAWNLGIAEASGEYLTSANTDDMLYVDGIGAMADYLDSHPEIGIVHGNCDLWDGDSLKPWIRPGESVSLAACRVGSMPLWRRSLHERFGMFDETMQVCGDYDFWLRCAVGGAGVTHIDKIVGIYRRRKDSLEGRNPEAMQKENRIIRERYSK